MATRLPLFVLAAAIAAMFVLSACGGGGSKAPAKDQVDDPSLVPSSTPIQNPPTFLIVGDKITTNSGATSTVAPNSSATTTTGTGQTYTVASGDTCYGIATQFGITIDALYKANGGEDGTCATLAVGDVMKIPGVPNASATPTPSQQGSGPGTGTASATPTPPAGGGNSGGQTYTVQSGDTCYGIATSLGVDPDAFVQANPGACDNLHEGDTLRVP